MGYSQMQILRCPHPLCSLSIQAIAVGKDIVNVVYLEQFLKESLVLLEGLVIHLVGRAGNSAN